MSLSLILCSVSGRNLAPDLVLNFNFHHRWHAGILHKTSVGQIIQMYFCLQKRNKCVLAVSLHQMSATSGLTESPSDGARINILFIFLLGIIRKSLTNFTWSHSCSWTQGGCGKYDILILTMK